MSIHPLAVVHPTARVGREVEIGPFCVVEPDTAIGDESILESHVIIKRGTELGPRNRVCEGAVLGGFPQHVHRPQHPGRVVIGSDNTIRENATIHRALERDDATVIGNNCLLMVNAHVAHDCRIGNHVIITNNALLAGHVTVGDRAYLSGAVAVHQFCRVGTLAMVGGQAHITRDVPPFVTVDGLSSLVVGLNQVGLRRAGVRADDRRALKAAYRVIYRSRLAWRELLEELQRQFPEGPAATFQPFLAESQRGIIRERRMPPGATIKLRRAAEAEEDREVHSKAG